MNKTWKKKEKRTKQTKTHNKTRQDKEKINGGKNKGKLAKHKKENIKGDKPFSISNTGVLN